MARKMFRGNLSVTDGEPVIVRCYRGATFRKIVAVELVDGEGRSTFAVQAYLEADDAKIIEHRMFEWVKTGQVIPIGGEYVDTIYLGPMELHLYEIVGAKIDPKEIMRREGHANRN
jgi:hypothetical protein